MQFEGYIEIEPGYWYCKKDYTPWSNKNKNNNGKGRTNYLIKINSINTQGYFIIRGNGGDKLWSRLVYKYFKGQIPEGFEVDHVDNIPLNNHPDNLELKNHKNNCRKLLKYKNNKSGYPGVSWNKKNKKWKSQIVINEKAFYLGLFNDPLEAFICYLENKIYYHGWDSILPII